MSLQLKIEKLFIGSVLYLWDFHGITQSWCSWKPTWSLNEAKQFVFPTSHSLHLFNDFSIVEKLHCKSKMHLLYRVRKANFDMGLKLNNWIIFCHYPSFIHIFKNCKAFSLINNDYLNEIIFLVQNVTWNSKLSWFLLCPDLSSTNNQAWEKSTNCFKKILLYYEC